jgi:hypothetical protein
MMLAVMYGMIPSAKMVSWRSAPPLNRLTRPNSPWEPPTLIDDLIVDARYRDVGSQPVQHHDAQREQQLLAQVGRPERPGERGEHGASCDPRDARGR